MTDPTLSIVVCTYQRSECLGRLLDSLVMQDQRDFEVVIVDAGETSSESARHAARFRKATGDQVRVSLVPSVKGLPRQRNVGLANASGDIVCFLDDDVTVEETFVSHICRTLEQPEMADVGGVTGYDVLHYGVSASMRYRIRRALGFYRRFLPGSVGICEATVPLTFQAPFCGSMDIGWLPGFCMAYRRRAIAQLRFDEELTAYGAEDAVFSLNIGRAWRLMMIGDLLVRHDSTPLARTSNAEAVYGASFALARSYFARSRGAWAFAAIAWYAAVEFCLDSLTVLRRPSLCQIRIVWARLAGLLEGIRSVRTSQQAVGAGGRV